MSLWILGMSNPFEVFCWLGYVFIRLLFCLARSKRYQMLMQWHQYASKWRRCVNNHSAVIVLGMLMWSEVPPKVVLGRPQLKERLEESIMLSIATLSLRNHTPLTGLSYKPQTGWGVCLGHPFRELSPRPFWLVSIEHPVGVPLILIIEGLGIPCFEIICFLLVSVVVWDKISLHDSPGSPWPHSLPASVSWY